ncbi:MAG: hypothetical protein ACREJC_23265, partial [Tepidisphaeraceae bacterium]
RTADLSGGKVGACGIERRVLRRHCRRLELDRIDRFDRCLLPRPVILPAARFLPRPVVHPTPRLESLPPPPPRECPTPVCPKGPLVPPWDMPVWKTPVQPAQKVKVHIHRPDVVNKGSLLDLFV